MIKEAIHFIASAEFVDFSLNLFMSGLLLFLSISAFVFITIFVIQAIKEYLL